MNCTQCGYQNPEGSRFCRQCGSPLQQQSDTAQQTAESSAPPPQPQPQAPYQPQGAFVPPQPYGQPPQPNMQQPYGMPPYSGAPKKKNTGLIIGLIAGGVVLVAAAVVLILLFMGGTPITGQWYCEEIGRAIVFNDDNTAVGYSLTGTFDTDYTYDKSKATGAFNFDGEDFTFKVDKDTLVLKGENKKATFEKLKDGSDVEALVLSALEGTWHSEELGEVIELKKGSATLYSSGSKGTYIFDLENGEGSITLDQDSIPFTADYGALSITSMGTFQKADRSFDIEAFMSEYAMPLVGIWYDTSGTYGTIEFYKDSTAQVIMFSEPLTATYTYDTATDTGTFYTDNTGLTSALTFADGVITIDGITYTKDYVEQLSAQDTLAAIIGTWYETTGALGTVMFYEDGSIGVDMYSEYYTGTYTYNALDSTGQIIIYVDGTDTTSNFSFDGTLLYIENYTYTRDYVQPVTGIEGIWYDMAGTSGTISFFADGSVLMDTYGVQLTGTYTFDVLTDTGSMTVSYLDESMSCNLSLYQGILDVEGVQYSLDYVEQIEVTGP